MNSVLLDTSFLINMTQQLLDEIHPGEILLGECMKPLGITALRLGLFLSLRRLEISFQQGLDPDLTIISAPAPPL